MSMSPELMTAVAGGAQAGQSYEAGQQNKAIYRYNAAQDRVQALQAGQEGQFALNRLQGKESLLRGAQTTAFAGQGVVASAGSARAVESAGMEATEMEKYLTEINTKRREFGYQMAAASETYKGQMAAFRGTEGAIGDLVKSGEEVGYEEDRENPRTAGSAKSKPLLSDGAVDVPDYAGSRGDAWFSGDMHTAQS